MQNFVEKAILFFLVVASVVIVFSQWIGFFFLNSLLNLGIGIIIGFFLLWFFCSKELLGFLRIPRIALAVALIAFLMSIFSFVFITPFFAPSSDPVHVITIRTLGLNEKIPSNYLPFSEFAFSYQFGFHLFAKIFTDFFWFAKDYQVLIVLGAIIIALEAIAFYWFSKVFVSSERNRLIAVALFIGAKIVFQNLYFGLHPWNFASVLFFVFVAMFHKKSKLSFVFFPVIFSVHPGVAVNMLAFFLFYLFFNSRETIFFFRHLPTLLLSAPILLVSYVPLALGFFSSKQSFFSFEKLFSILQPLPLTLGLVPLLFFAFSILFLLFRKRFSRNIAFFSCVFAFSVLFYSYFSFGESNFASKVLELFTVSAILISVLALDFENLSKKLFSLFLLAVVLFSVVSFFFFSGYLSYLRAGDKIDWEEAEFAFAFEKIDSSLQNTLFLTDGGAKMAELSNKIPFNVKRDYFVAYPDFQAKHDNGLLLENEKAALFKRIVNGCKECVYQTNAKYVVLNKNFVSFELDEEKLLVSKNIVLYGLG